MNASRFTALNPNCDWSKVEVVTHPNGREPTASSPWSVLYGGRIVTSGDLFYCVQWVAYAKRGRSY